MNQSGLLFLPQRWQRANVLRWLKRTHAWTGFWGAILFLMMGVSGFLLNHRDMLKIDTGKPVEVSAVDVTVPAGGFKDADAMAAWAKATYGLNGEGRAPPKSDEGKGAVLGKALPAPEKWVRSFALPDGRLTISSVPGASFATVKREGQGILSTLKTLHKGTGLGIVWVLFLDTIAGALITMALTGFLLWTRLHGSRLLAGALAGGSIAVAAWAVVPNLL